MKRGFAYLLVATVLALVAVLVFVPGENAVENSAVDALLLPELTDRINDVDQVEIVTAGDTVVATIIRTSVDWQLEQMDGYHADWPKLQALLAGLAQARVIEAKTDKPKYYQQLGVEDVSLPDADSVLVKLGIGDNTTGVVIGHQAQGRVGQYVRLQDTAESALLDRTLDVSTELLDWADTRIIDINASEVAEVEIVHADGERVLITRISADQTDFDLAGLPPGREVQSSWSVNSFASSLSLLDLESVRLQKSVDWQAAARMRLLTFSGLEIIAEIVDADGQYLLQLSASHPAAQAVDYGNDDISQQAAEDVARRVDEINQRVSGWAYGIPKYKFEGMVKTQADILKPIEST